MTCLLHFYHSDDMSGIDSDYDVFMCKGFLNADLHEIYPLILISGKLFFFCIFMEKECDGRGGEEKETKWSWSQ